MPLRDPEQCAADLLHGRPRRLPSVHRRDDHPPALQRDPGHWRCSRVEGHRRHELERVDGGVSGDVDPVLRDPLLVEVLGADRGRREVEVGDHTGHAPVHLLRPGVALVERAQSRLDVGDLATVMEGA